MDSNCIYFPDNDLISVAVDQYANKWIGSSKYGLIKFNDTSCTIFNKNNSLIKGDYISNIVGDKKIELGLVQTTAGRVGLLRW